MYVAKNGPQHYHRECMKVNAAMNKKKRVQHCWKEAVMELDGTKPIWVLPATSKAVPA